MAEIQKIYLSQIAQIANGITAFAIAQSLAVTVAIFSAESFAKQVHDAKPVWLWLGFPLGAGITVYFAFIFVCYRAERRLLLSTGGGKDLLWAAKSFAWGRAMAILLAAIPLGLAMHAVL